jgi:phosphate:Na+ symporter
MLSYALGTRFKAFLAGLGATSILQSSTATGLMVTAFAAGGLVGVVPGHAALPGQDMVFLAHALLGRLDRQAMIAGEGFIP